MDGQVMTVLGDISSLLQELETMMQGRSDEAEIMEPAIGLAEEPAEKKPTDETPPKDEEEKIIAQKGLEQTESDGMTANDPAPERVEEPLPEESAENVDDVAKAIIKLLSKKKEVVKSAPKAAPVSGKLVQVVKAIAEKQQDIESALLSVLQGFGVAGQIEKQFDLKEKEKIQKGRNNPKDIEATLAYLAKHMQKGDEPKQTYGVGNHTEVVKTLRNPGILTAMIKDQK